MNTFLLDRNRNQIKPGDLLLNVEDERSFHDAWAFWFCYYCDKNQSVVIRDFNAWNLTWIDSKNLVILGNYKNFPEILKANQKTIEDLDGYVKQT